MQLLKTNLDGTNPQIIAVAFPTNQQYLDNAVAVSAQGLNVVLGNDLDYARDVSAQIANAFASNGNLIWTNMVLTESGK